jgi:hypothetical protein
MATEKNLKQHIVNLLTGNDAHAEYERVVADLPEKLRGERAKGAEHSAWQILEHLRITQWDIVEFSRNARHTSPEFPAGYWPKTQSPLSAAAWDKSIKDFLKDRAAFCELVMAESTDLLAKIPHGDGQTILREALLAADHTAYHLGEFVLLRRMLGAWK